MRTRLTAILACGVALMACAQGAMMIRDAGPPPKWESPPGGMTFAQVGREPVPAITLWVNFENARGFEMPEGFVLRTELGLGSADLELKCADLVPPPGYLVKIAPGEGKLPAMVTTWPEEISRPPNPLFRVRWHGGKAIATLHDADLRARGREGGRCG